MKHAPTDATRFLFFAGKGGVGKTTCAAAYAVAAARAGSRVLVASTDPAHSLGDALGVRLSARVSPVAVGRQRLHAVELDAPRAFARWMAEHGQALGDILEHGTWLDRDDVDALLGLSIPGVDELLGLIEIGRMVGPARERLRERGAPPRLNEARVTPATEPPDAYDLVVVDTAPTGHTLHLLGSPETVAAVADVLDALQEQHRMIREQLARVARPEAADRLIALIATQARETGGLLRDARRTALRWVLLPEELSVAESEDGLRALEEAGIPVDELIVNRVTEPGPSCPVCDRRRLAERRVIEKIPRRLGTARQVRRVAAQGREPRGIASLARLGRELHAEIRAKANTADRKRPSARLAQPAYSSPDAPHTPPEVIAALRGARLLMFGGKGGVGKTTCAAAAAIHLAHAQPSSHVLLLSTDPAHSLGDVFDAAIGDRGATVAGAPPNLHVRELDARAVLAAHRRDLEDAVDEIAGAVGGHEALGDRGARELMDLAPPGIDELLGIVSMADLLASHDQVVILDTAPTGHALRLLEMPDAARDWVQVLLRVLHKYRDLVRPGRLAAELVELSKSIRGLQALLRSPTDTRFIVVTRAAEVPRAETERLMDRLRRLRLAAPALVVNALTLAPGRCPRCRATAAAERRELTALTRACRRRSRRCAIIVTPLAEPPPRGAAALDRWANLWSA